MALPKITKAELVKSYKEKATDQMIADSIGVTRQAVHQMRMKYGIPKVSGRYDARDKEILKQFKKGDHVNNIAANHGGLSVSQVYRIVKRASKQKKG